MLYTKHSQCRKLVALRNRVKVKPLSHFSLLALWQTPVWKHSMNMLICPIFQSHTAQWPPCIAYKRLKVDSMKVSYVVMHYLCKVALSVKRNLCYNCIENCGIVMSQINIVKRYYFILRFKRPDKHNFLTIKSFHPEMSEGPIAVLNNLCIY